MAAATAAPMDREVDLMERYEIADYFAGKMQQLEGYEICIICDDSESMATPLQNTQGGAFAKSVTRWEELKNIVGIVVDIAAMMNTCKDGVDIFFLNRATLLNVTSSQQLQPVFANPPAGLTPITPVLQHILEAKKQIMVEKKLLVVILTDGQPTNPFGEIDIPGLQEVMQFERNVERCYVTFVACTDDLNAVNYLNDWDRKMKHVDVVDDYVSERTMIQKKKGANFQFSVGDYVVKSLLGSIDPEVRSTYRDAEVAAAEEAAFLHLWQDIDRDMVEFEKRNPPYCYDGGTRPAQKPKSWWRLHCIILLIGFICVCIPNTIITCT